MPYATNGTERARPDLAATLFEYDLVANMNAMVAFEVFPIHDVPVFKGTYGRVEAKELMKRHPNVTANPPGYAFLRAPRAAYAEDDQKFTEDDFRTQEHGLQGRVDENEAEAYASYFEQESFVTQHVNNQLMTETEVRVAAAAFDQTTFSPGLGRGTAIPAAEQWSNPTTATPVKHFRNASFAMYARSGVWPDSVVMNKFAWSHLIETEEIRSRVHSQGAGSPERATLITRQIVGQIIQIPNIIVAGGTMDAANANAAFQPAQIWGPHALVYKRSMTRNLREIALGRSFHWAQDNSMPRGYVESYYDPDVRCDKIRVRHQMENKLIYPEVGHLLTDVYA